jgi:replicative DNA helicase
MRIKKNNELNNKKIFAKIKFNLKILDLMIYSLFSENTLVDRKYFLKIGKLLGIINIETYTESREIYIRLAFLKTFTDCYLKEHVTRQEFLTEKLSSHELGNEFMNIINFSKLEELSNDDILYIDGYITERLSKAFIFEKKDYLITLLNELEIKDNISDTLENLKNEVSQLNRDFIQNKAKTLYEKKDFDLSRENLNIIASNTLSNRKLAKNKIITPIQRLNDLLNGGFKSRRVYTFLALPGKWKSGLLLNCCIWAHMFNPEIKSSDPTKIPAVLYVTLENDDEETFERCYSHIQGNRAELEDCPNSEEIVNIFEEYGLIADHSNILFKYRATMTIDTNDISCMLDDANDEGYEVILVVVDYLARLRPNFPQLVNDEYASYGMIVDDLSTLAKTRNIPVITAGQLNREGEKVVENAEGRGIKNIVSKLGRSNTSGSRKIIDNSDVVILINPEDGYLGFSRLKHRDKLLIPTKIFYQPYQKGNGMKLVHDIDEPSPLGKLDLSDGFVNKFKSQQNSGKYNNELNEKILAITEERDYNDIEDLDLEDY